MKSSPEEDVVPASGMVQSSAVTSGGVRPERLTRWLLLLYVLGVCDRNYWFYSHNEHTQPGVWLSFVHGVGLAPEQYRVGVKMAAWWFCQHLHWGFRHAFTLFDVIATLAAVYLLYDVLLHKKLFRTGSRTLQWLASMAFVLLVSFYLAWVELLDKPETLPCMGVAAVLFWLWSARSAREPRLSRHLLIAAGVLAVTALEATIRADVACFLNAGMFLVSLRRSERALSLPRNAALATSAAATLLAAGVQLYMMKVAYPHATYGTTPIFMAPLELKQPLNYIPFFLFMAPVLWTAAKLLRGRRSEDLAGPGLLLGSIPFLLLWVLIGKIDEVRIFIPFAVALIPLTVELLLGDVEGARTTSTGHASASGPELRDA